MSNRIKQHMFKASYESARKDVERVFCVLKKQFKIRALQTRILTINMLRNIMYVHIILHNMILEDECQTFHMYDESEDEDEDSKEIDPRVYKANIRELHKK